MRQVSPLLSALIEAYEAIQDQQAGRVPHQHGLGHSAACQLYGEGNCIVDWWVAYEQGIWLPMYASGDTLTANWQES